MAVPPVDPKLYDQQKGALDASHLTLIARLQDLQKQQEASLAAARAQSAQQGRAGARLYGAMTAGDLRDLRLNAGGQFSQDLQLRQQLGRADLGAEQGNEQRFLRDIGAAQAANWAERAANADTAQRGAVNDLATRWLELNAQVEAAKSGGGGGGGGGGGFGGGGRGGFGGGGGSEDLTAGDAGLLAQIDRLRSEKGMQGRQALAEASPAMRRFLKGRSYGPNFVGPVPPGQKGTLDGGWLGRIGSERAQAIARWKQIHGQGGRNGVSLGSVKQFFDRNKKNAWRVNKRRGDLYQAKRKAQARGFGV